MSIDGFTEVGNSKLLLVEELLTYSEAKTRCKGSASNLAEFWNDQEWNEVTDNLPYTCTTKYLLLQIAKHYIADYSVGKHNKILHWSH